MTEKTSEICEVFSVIYRNIVIKLTNVVT